MLISPASSLWVNIRRSAGVPFNHTSIPGPRVDYGGLGKGRIFYNMKYSIPVNKTRKACQTCPGLSEASPGKRAEIQVRTLVIIPGSEVSFL